MRIVIIGGVAAGMSAAAKLKRLNPQDEVVVYEKTEIVSFGACGLPYYVGGFFEDKEEMLARPIEAFRKKGIDLLTRHEVIEVDFPNKKLKIKNHLTGENREDYYDKLMIATGASSIIPAIPGSELQNIRTLKSMEDGTILRTLLQEESCKKIVVIGAGFIGLEVVEALKYRGKEVCIIEREDRILKKVMDPEVTDLLENELKRQQVPLYLNEEVCSFEGEEKVKYVVTNQRTLEADAVILAMGFKPNTDFLKHTPLERLSNGAIVVDAQGRTSIEDVYAAGDCATIWHALMKKPVYVPLATGANKLGRIVGENLSGRPNAFEGSLASSCIKVLDMEAGRTGLTEEEARLEGFEYKTTFIEDTNQTSYYPGGNKIAVKLIYERETYKLLGGQVVGYKDAVQRTNVLAACIFAGVTTKQLGLLDLCYAPPFARTWDVLNVAGNVCK
ncbi:CoA-disulfide reductase [Sporanaerobium hydrogeniformans]|uniref:CoA-disulfide reductase n=1 Tax=Sporanaerobium hydrogeniformans TaxID=3072179 RepID=A0AC61DFK0_9FIRM|nr:CoA-disulfide reductase [Sporanaerobium hydrogeniformans]PHV71994.1 CoA-disulfide reductase [Sporanaerobium hydrogeniformans]